MKSLFLFAIFVLVLSHSVAVPFLKPIARPVSDDVDETLPGFKTIVSSAGLDYFRSVGVQLLQKKVANLTVPDMSGEDHTAVGRVEWTISNFVLLNTNFGSSAIKLVPGQGPSLVINSMSCSITLDWHYRKVHWPHVSDHGTASISSVSDVSVSLQVTTANQRPHLNVVADNVNLDTLDIKLHGGASWLYDFFIHVLHDSLKHSIEKALRDSLTMNINNGVNQALSTLQILQTVNKDVEVDLGLTATPTFTADYMEFEEVGEFYASANPQECPAQYCPSITLPNGINNGKMVNMMISDFETNSAGFVFWKLNKLHVTITDSELPSWAPIRLNTTAFQYILPPLYQKYPDMLIQLYVYSIAPPQAHFTPSGVTVAAPGNIEVSVVLPSGAIQQTFVLTGSISSTGIATLNGMSIIGNLTYMQGNFTLASSNIGPLSINTLTSLLNLMFSNGIIPEVNTYLQTGINLPVINGVSLLSPSLGYSNGYMTVSSNIHYDPPAFNAQSSQIIIH